MITLLGASKLFCCDRDFKIISEGGVVFESGRNARNSIIAFGEYASLRKQYPHAHATFHSEAVLLPALCNPHIHFEFSNNKTSLIYGDFGQWLESVIAKRESLLEEIQESINAQIQIQLQSGISSVGAISSYGLDIAPLSHSPLRVQLFNEAIGSNPAMLDELYSHLLSRLNTCQELANGRFLPALSIHSPYSTHKVLAQRVSSLAREEDLLLSCHFLESAQELQWLTHSQGFFKDFFAKHFTYSNKNLDALEFLELLEENETLFVHCLYANLTLLEKIASLKAKVISSPRSNRLLNNCYLDLNKLKSVGLAPIFSTDGLSSNFSLNLLDELRYGLFAYPDIEINALAKDLILGVTLYAHEALRFEGGEIAVGKNADLALFACEQISQSTQEAMHFILHCQHAKELYINGEGVLPCKA